MDSLHKLFFTAFLILAAAIDGARADAMVTGTVFCDQCKDGQQSLLDYPLNGIKVTVSCQDSNGQITMSKEDTTNWLGGYAMRFEGTPDLSGCYAKVSGSDQGSNACGAAAGPAQKLRPLFGLFNLEMYVVNPLLSEPAQPMAFCPKPTNPVPAPVTPVRPPPPPFTLPPLPKLPPLPPLPPMPPMPFFEASACPHEKWTRPEYQCYWRVVSPDTKVAVAFGLGAARRYGTDITLRGGLQGRADPYRTLLREGITALLNSYNSLQYPFPTLAVIQHMNWALMGSRRQVLHTALRFMQANSGSGNIKCKLTPCK